MKRLMKLFAAVSLVLFAFRSCASAQVSVAPYRTSRASFTTSTGQPLSGGCIFTYQGGTTTPQATYTDYTGNTANPNPVVLDTTGSAIIWLGPNSYKFVVTAAPSSGTCATNPGATQYTVDQVTGNTFVGAISGATIMNPTITGGTMDNTIIGATTPAPVNGSYLNGPIGLDGGNPAAGAFTSLSTAVDNMSFSATPAFNADLYGYFSMTLTGNVTSSTISGGQTGQQITIFLQQNGTGGYTFAWPSNLSFSLYNLGNGESPAFSLIPGYGVMLTAVNNGVDWIVTSETPQFLYGNVDNMSFSSTPIFNANAYTTFFLTLTGNVASSSITGNSQLSGQFISIQVCENATGGYTFAWPGTLTGAPAINTAANACTSVVAVSDIVASEPWIVVSNTQSSNTAYGQTQLTGPAAPTSATYTMQGMGASITPSSTGRIHAQYGATVTCGTLTGPADGVSFRFYYGTGSAPANGSSVTGTVAQISSNPVAISYLIPTTVTAGDVEVPVSKDFIVTGLALGTAYWFDAAAAYQGAAGCGATAAQITLQEF